MTEIREDQRIKRALHVYGIDGTVYVYLTKDGIEFKAQGTKVGVSAPWVKIVEACNTPPNVKSYLAGYPLTFLQEQAKQASARRAKKEEENEKG